jgi:hypothetical protein
MFLTYSLFINNPDLLNGQCEIVQSIVALPDTVNPFYAELKNLILVRKDEYDVGGSKESQPTFVGDDQVIKLYYDEVTSSQKIKGLLDSGSTSVSVRSDLETGKAIEMCSIAEQEKLTDTSHRNIMF